MLHFDHEFGFTVYFIYIYSYKGLSLTKLNMIFFFLQEREQKQKLLDPYTVRTSQRFSETHVNQVGEVCTCFGIVFKTASDFFVILHSFQILLCSEILSPLGKFVFICGLGYYSYIIILCI